MTVSKKYEEQSYYIKTFGCQANIADSSSMAGILESLNFNSYKVVNSDGTEDQQLFEVLSNADIFIINTCSVRQKSEDKVYGIGKVVKKVQTELKRKPFIIMSGCMVGSVTGDRKRYDFAELKKKTPWVDMYMNPSQISNLPQLLLEQKLLDEWAVKKFHPDEILPKNENPNQAFVNISYGCDNFCTFCVVPYARGAEVSRKEEDILREVQHLVQRGFRDITLCGQNVNSWGLSMSDKFEIRTGSDQVTPFVGLLRKVLEMENLEKISFISSNPFDFTSGLIDLLGTPKVGNYLHIAVQSGNDEVLKRMNRRHSIRDFYDLVGRIRRVRPNIELGTDIIVGFPGETREQFMDTVKMVEDIGFNVAFISMYSPRKGTPAERFFTDDVEQKEKKWRHAHLTKVFNSTKKGPKS